MKGLVDLRARLRDATRRGGEAGPFDSLSQEALGWMALGVLAGLLGGFAAVLFDGVVLGLSELWFGAVDPSVSRPQWWLLLVLPALGGAGSAMLTHRGTLKGRPQGIVDVIEQVGHGSGHLSLREAWVSALAAALALGTGVCGGREGPIVQLGAAFSSKITRLLGVDSSRRRVLVAAAGAASIAASFNAPIGAVFFAMEVLLGSFAMEMFGPVVVATVTGTVIGQAFLGQRLALVLPDFTFEHWVEFPLYALMGVALGLALVAFKHGTLGVAWALEGLAVPAGLKGLIAGGGAGVAAALGLNEVLGNGYPYLGQLLGDADPSVTLLLALLVAKTLASGAAAGAGTGTGLYAPTLFVGAVAGTLFGVAAGAVAPGVADPGAYGMVGMGVALVVITQAPVTGLLMLFEMTGNYQVILPMMLAMATAGIVVRAVGSTSLYRDSLERRGVALDRSREQLVMYNLRVEDVMRSDQAETMRPGEHYTDLLGHFMNRRVDLVYLLDAEGRYRGQVGIQDLKDLLLETGEGVLIEELGELHLVVPGKAHLDVVHKDVPTLVPDMPLADSLDLFYRSHHVELPVVDAAGKLVGTLHERDIVGAYHREVLRCDALLARFESDAGGQHHTDFVELPEGEVVDSVTVGKGLEGLTLRVLHLPSSHGLNVLAVSEYDAETGAVRRVHPDLDRRLVIGDRLVVLGPVAEVERLRRRA